MKTRAHVIVSGYVQGVFFRETTKRWADNHNVKGWVGNRDDGKVEAVFEGEEAAVKALVDYCHRGPSLARVDSVDVTWEEFVGEFSDFEIA